MSLAEAFARDGYVVVPQVLSSPEVTRLRQEVTAVLATDGAMPYGLGSAAPNASVGCPALRWVFHHPPVLTAVRRALGGDELLFTMEAGAHRNVTGPWHKDTGEHAVPGGYFDHPAPWDDDSCVVVKVGLYLQDHLDGTGLRVRPGSHRRGDLTGGDEVAPAVRAGDAVLFDVRITHRGQAPTRLDRGIASVARAVPRRRRQAVVARSRVLARAVARRPDRLAVFFAFGPRSERTEVYGRRNLERQLAQLGRAAALVDPSFDEALRASGVEPLGAG
jgi:hypothetical protein